jgi:ABC-type tungstate transport system substrate-binding protein
MSFMYQSLLEGLRELGHDPQLGRLTVVTLRLAVESTAIALLLGLPLACVLGLGSSRTSRGAMLAANAGLGLPAVAVGVYARLLLTSPGLQPPSGGSWLNSINGMVLCQTVIALPIIIALGAVAVRAVPSALFDQARAFGASTARLSSLAVREARLGVATAVIVALGSAIGEVGAITLIIPSAGPNETLATQVIQDNFQSDRAREVEHVLVLLAMLLALGLTLVLIRRADPLLRRRRARARQLAAVGAPL